MSCVHLDTASSANNEHSGDTSEIQEELWYMTTNFLDPYPEDKVFVAHTKLPTDLFGGECVGQLVTAH